MRVSKNFDSVKDYMQCPCCNSFMFDEKAMARFQTLRDLMGTPFYLTKSGGGFYRCRIYQDSIGGVSSSQHTLGKAMDVLTHGWNGAVKWKFIKEASNLGLSIGIYEHFFHIDYRDGSPVMWYG